MESAATRHDGCLERASRKAKEKEKENDENRIFQIIFLAASVSLCGQASEKLQKLGCLHQKNRTGLWRLSETGRVNFGGRSDQTDLCSSFPQ